MNGLCLYVVSIFIDIHITVGRMEDLDLYGGEIDPI